MEKQLVYTTANDKREISVYNGERKECIVSKKGRYVPSENYTKFKASLQIKRGKSFLVESISSGIFQNIAKFTKGVLIPTK
jgi:hypothetical protein